MYNQNNNNDETSSSAVLFFLVIGFFLALTMFGANLARAQVCQEPTSLCFYGVSRKQQTSSCTFTWHNLYQEQVYKLQHAVLESLTLRIDADGNPVYAGSCSRDYFGCEGRIRSLVEIIVHESIVAKVDPWIVAGMVWHESRFNPFAESHLGTRGIMQLHPRNSRFSSNRFLHRDAYRNRCRRIEGNCQAEVVQDGTKLLRDAIDRCDGTLVQGLTMYNTGRCAVGGNRYVQHAFMYRSQLIETLTE